MLLILFMIDMNHKNDVNMDEHKWDRLGFDDSMGRLVWEGGIGWSRRVGLLFDG